MANLEYEIGSLLRQKGLTLGIVESATGGLISLLITNVPGSSDYYKGSVTAYSNEVKMRVIGVKEASIDKYGAVSCQVAEEMARGGRKILGADICLADSGIAGPGGGLPRENQRGYSISDYPIRREPTARDTVSRETGSKTNRVPPRQPWPG